MIGIDEVGRGAWAGPLLVVAARQNVHISIKLQDSKKLTKNQRQDIYEKLRRFCNFGEGWVSHEEIDRFGLTAAMRLGVQRALSDLGADPNEKIIMDGKINYCQSRFNNVECIAKADDNFSVVSAASIYAKVLRDNYMIEKAEQHTGYGFDKHVGYGTKQHIDALRLNGVCEIHRLSYKPVGAML